MRVTNDPADAFAFRTPSLRNVTLTAPYGHAGAYSDLRTYLEHHARRGAELSAYSLEHATLPELAVTKPDLSPSAEAADFPAILQVSQDGLAPINRTLEARQLDDLVAFLKVLEDPAAVAGGMLGIPESVPSGLAIER